MIIENVKVNNYRNIGGIDVMLHPQCNYIIGENNIGKSNFLTLLTTIFNGRCFSEDDFENENEPIVVDVSLRLNSYEKGFFDDNFSPDDDYLIRLRISQRIDDGRLNVICTDSNESILLKQLRKISFLRYDTTLDPSKELRMDTQKGAGPLMRNIVNKYVDVNNCDFLNKDSIESLTGFINNKLGMIKTFQDYSIQAMVSPDAIDMLTNLFYLAVDGRDIESTGSGIQYTAMACLNILSQIMGMKNSKTVKFNDLLYTDSDGRVILPLILSIDEPEVHLHPYLQRSLIGYYKRILSNGDDSFNQLLKAIFEIDGINGQLIIVTHSTDALIGDYRNLVRFCRTCNKTEVVSGIRLKPGVKENNTSKIKTDIEKHLIMHFPEIKEAFYSKCVIFVEGCTEYGCIHSFSEKMGVILDDYGICVISADGESSIKPLQNLLDLFKIPSIAIYDGDVKPGKKIRDNDFYTNELCFEFEVVKTLYKNSRTDLVKSIVKDIKENAFSDILTYEYLKEGLKKKGISRDCYEDKKLSDIDETDENEFCLMYSLWLYKNKGVILGRIIGNLITPDCIPNCYKEAIMKAKEVAMNV